MTVAVLFAYADGPYAGLEGVDVWCEERDARLYAGPHPVVAHPPCARWGRYWSGGPSAKVRRELGDDGGCFEAALAAVRRWGGVLEHPEASHAWSAHGLTKPPKSGGWIPASIDTLGWDTPLQSEWDPGWTCCVEQGHYGHRSRKATWLYAVGLPELPSLKWGPAAGKIRLEDGCHDRASGVGVGRERISAREASETPTAFRDLLLEMARSAG